MVPVLYSSPLNNKLMSFNIITQSVKAYANLASFPATGESNVLYIDEATNISYYWTGAVYTAISSGGGSFDYANATGITQITDFIISPTILNADQDDYNPTGFSTCNMIRQAINGSRVITGFQAPPAGVNRFFGICNIDTNDTIKFKNNDSSSAAANRILLRDNGPDKTIKENETAIFWYDHISLRYRPYNRIG